MEFLYISFLAFLFGFFQKIADGHDEHGLNWFKGAGIFFGIIWGFIGFYLVSITNIIMISYLAIVLYWIYKLKIDYINHAISVIIILFGVFLSGYGISNYYYVFILLTLYIIFDFIKIHFKSKFKYLYLFFNYRLQFFIVPIIFSVYMGDILGIVIVFNLFGVYFANKIFKIKNN